MKALIEAVRAEAQAIVDSAYQDDRYHQEQLDENMSKRSRALDRVKACDEALEAIDDAARSLTTRKKP